MVRDALPEYTCRLMDKNYRDENNPPENATAAVCIRIPVTYEQVQVRTRGLALLAGHVPPHVSQANYEQAKREVTGESDADRQEAMLNPN